VTDVEGHEDPADVQKVGADSGEVLLSEGGGAESGRGRGPKDQLLGRFHARRQLGILRVAEIGVVLEASGQAEPQKGSHVSFEVHIRRHAAARVVHLVGGPESGKDLRSRGRPSAELVLEPSVDVGVGLARELLIILASELRSEGDVQRTGHSDLELAGHVEI
jgi:hypothetical protein